MCWAVHFRYTLVAHGVQFLGDHDLSLRLHSTSTVVVLRAHPGAAIAVAASTEVTPPDPILEAFVSLSRGTMPTSAAPFETLTTKVAPGEDLQRFVPSLASMPLDMQEMVWATQGQLSRAAEETWRLVRWRLGLRSGRHSFSTQGADFSLDGEAWIPVPTNTGVSAEPMALVRPNHAIAASLQAAIDDALTQPTAYDLLREADDVAGTNQRSGLLIAVAALETGIKSFIARRVPEAEWLAMEAPSRSRRCSGVTCRPWLSRPVGTTVSVKGF